MKLKKAFALLSVLTILCSVFGSLLLPAASVSAMASGWVNRRTINYPNNPNVPVPVTVDKFFVDINTYDQNYSFVSQTANPNGCDPDSITFQYTLAPGGRPPAWVRDNKIDNSAFYYNDIAYNAAKIIFRTYEKTSTNTTTLCTYTEREIGTLGGINNRRVVFVQSTDSRSITNIMNGVRFDQASGSFGTQAWFQERGTQSPCKDVIIMHQANSYANPPSLFGGQQNGIAGSATLYAARDVSTDGEGQFSESYMTQILGLVISGPGKNTDQMCYIAVRDGVRIDITNAGGYGLASSNDTNESFIANGLRRAGGWFESGAERDDAFVIFVGNEATNMTPTDSGDTPITVGDDPQTGNSVCDQNPGGNGLSWLFCAASDALLDALKSLDSIILNQLKINTEDIFGSGPNGTAFRKAWSAFRTVAYAILVILGLVMIISQIMDLDLFNAYTLRKMLFKMLVVAVVIPLLWPLLKLGFELSNDATDAVQGLLFAPFKGTATDAITCTDGNWSLDCIPDVISISAIIAGGAVGALGIGAFLAFGGWGVVLAMAGSGFLAIGSAAFILVARDVAAYALIIPSAIAVVCAIFKAFEPVFTFWRRFVTTILIATPAVGAVLAASKIGAKIALVANQGSIWGAILAFIFIVIGYAMFWKTFTALDQVSSKFGNVVSGVTNKAQKALGEYRNRTYKRRWGEFRNELRGDLEKGKRGGRLNPMRYVRTAAAMTNRIESAGLPGGSMWGAGALQSQQAHALHVADEALKRDNNKEAGDDDKQEAVKGAHNTEHAIRRLASRYSRKDAAAAKDTTGKTLNEAEEAHKATLQGGQFASEEERWQWRNQWIADRQGEQTQDYRKKTRKRAQDDIQRWMTSFGFTEISGAARVAAAKALSASNTSMREESWRSFDEALATDVEMDRELIDEHIVSDSDMTSIKVANKGRERAAAGWSGQFKLLTDKDEQGKLKDIKERLRDFKRGALKGSGPGATVGQRWEQVVALAPEMTTMLKEADATLDPAYGQLVTQLTAGGATPQQAAQQAQVQIEQAHQQTYTATFQATMAALQQDPTLQDGHARVYAEAQGRGLSAQQAAMQAQAWWVEQAEARAQQAGMAAVLNLSNPGGKTEALDEAIERFAMLDNMYKLSSQISRLAGKPLTVKTLSQNYTWLGMTMSGEQWVRFLESSSVPPLVAEKYRQARFSYGAQAEAARQAGAAAGGGQAGGMPNPGGGSDRRIKTAILPVAVVNGLQLYRFRYLLDEQVYVGVIAQDLLRTRPEAIQIGGHGFYLVDYAILGLRMCTIEEWHSLGTEAVLLDSTHAATRAR